MNIGVDIRTLSFRRGGISQYTYCLLKSMLRADTRNAYFLFTYIKSPYEWDTFRGNAKEVVLRFPQRPFLKLIWENVLAPIAARKHQIDVWFSPDFIIPKRLRAKSVITIHDLIFEEFHDPSRNSDAAAFSRKVEDSVRRADKIIAISDFTKGRMVQRYKLSEEKVIRVHQAADERFHRIQDQEAIERVLRRYGIQDRFILFVGEISKRKNLDRLLKAYHLLHTQEIIGGRKLVLVGKRTSETDRILREVDSLSLQSEVLLTGYVPDEDLPFIYNSADVFVFPSLYEGFGIPLLEAMKCEIPVIASNTTAIPEVVVDSGLLFDPEKPEDIADKIDLVINDKIDVNKLISKAKRHADNFSWSMTAAQTLEIINSLSSSIGSSGNY